MKKVAIGLVIVSLIPFWGVFSYASSSKLEVTKKEISIQNSVSFAELLPGLSAKFGVTLIVSKRKVSDYFAEPVEGIFDFETLVNRVLFGTPFHLNKISSDVYAIVSAPLRTQDVSSELVEEVFVRGTSPTGSHLWDVEHFVLPKTQIINASSLHRSPSGLSAERLQSWVTSNSGNSMNSSVGNGADSSSRLSLRGLPARHTLVLLNGKRVAKWGVLSRSINMNLLPLFAAGQVDVLSQGASAIYGTDAVAGTVNIQMIEEYDGLNLTFSNGISSQNDVKTRRVSTVGGRGFELAGKPSEIVVAAHYEFQDALFARDRNISSDQRSLGGADLRSSATPQSRIYFEDGRILIPIADINDDIPLNERFRAATSEDLYDFYDSTSTVMPLKKMGLYFHWHSHISESGRVGMSLDASRMKGVNTRAPQPLFSDTGYPNWSISSDNSFNPFVEAPTQIRRRLVEAGPRELTDTAQGLNGSAFIRLKPRFQNRVAQWDMEIWDSRTKLNENFSNLVDREKLNLAAGDERLCGLDIACVPLNLYGPAGSINQEQLAYILSESELTVENRVWGGSTRFASKLPLFKGTLPLQYMFGAMLYEELLFHELDSEDMATDIDFDARRQVREFFMEYSLPVSINKMALKALETKFAIRYAKYSSFSPRMSPSLEFIYHPVDSLAIHASTSDGYTAPTLYDMHSLGVIHYLRAEDPCVDRTLSRILPGCSGQSDSSINQFATVEFGNAQLSPELSHHTSFGFSWYPSRWKGFALDLFYYATQIDDTITVLSAQELIDDQAYHGDSGTLPGEVERDAQGNIAFVRTSFINRGHRSVDSMDIKLKGENVVFNDVSVEWSLNATKLIKFTDSSFGGNQNLVGTYYPGVIGGNGALPEWHIKGSLSFLLDKFGIYYHVHYLSGMTEVIPKTDMKREIDNWFIHDVSFEYRLPLDRDISIQAGIENVFDEKAPLVTSSYNNAMDARSHNLKGRYFSLGLVSHF